MFSGARVLDVGCGPGTITLGVAKLCLPGEVIGIDPDESSIEVANKMRAAAQTGNIKFQIGDGTAINFDDDTFDVTYSHAMLPWLDEPVKAVQEQIRVTRKAGWVLTGIGGASN